MESKNRVVSPFVEESSEGNVEKIIKISAE
jgi:hypothetical protein